MTPCISQSCTLTASFPEEVKAWSEAGWPAVEIWLTKLEDHLKTSSIADTKQLLADRGIAVVAASYQGGLLASHGEAQKVHFDHFKSRLDLCEALGIPTLIIAADFHSKVTSDDLALAVHSLTTAGHWAAGFGVRLALEFRGRDAICNNLETAARLVAASGEANVGVALDVFHYYTGSSKFEDLELLNSSNLMHVQLCDLPGLPREIASDSDRILPGDGDWQLLPLVQKIKSCGYNGPVSLELHNPAFWQSDPGQVTKLGMASMRRLLDKLS